MRFYAIVMCLFAATCDCSPVRSASGASTSSAQSDVEGFAHQPSLLSRGASSPPSFIDDSIVGRTGTVGSSSSSGKPPLGRDVSSLSRSGSLMKGSASSRTLNQHDRIRRFYYGYARHEPESATIEVGPLEELAMSESNQFDPETVGLPHVAFSPSEYDIDKDRVALWKRYETGHITWPYMIETAKILHRERRSVIIQAMFTNLGETKRSGSSPLSPEKGRGIFADEDMDCSSAKQCEQVVSNAAKYKVAIKEPTEGAAVFYHMFPSIDFLLWKPDVPQPQFESYGTKKQATYDTWHDKFIELARDVEKSLSGKMEATGIKGDDEKINALPLEVVLESLNKIRKYLTPSQQWQQQKMEHVTAWERIIQIRKALYRSLNNDDFYAYEALAQDTKTNWTDVTQRSFKISKMVLSPDQLVTGGSYEFWTVVAEQQAASLEYFKQLLDLSWEQSLTKAARINPAAPNPHLISLNHALVRLEVLKEDPIVTSNFPKIVEFETKLRAQIKLLIPVTTPRGRRATSDY